MKKLITFALAAVLAMSMSLTAFAETSITIDPEAGNAVGKDSAGNVIETTEPIIVETEANEAKREEAKAALAASRIDGTIVDVVEAWTNAPGQEVLAAGGSLTITFTVAGAKSTDNYVVLHQLHNGTWEVLNGTAGEGTVTATFTSLSPVVFVKLASATTDPETNPEPVPPATADPTPAPTTNSESTPAPAPAPASTASPKTADFGMAGILSVMAVCAAGLVFVNKKEEV